MEVSERFPFFKQDASPFFLLKDVYYLQDPDSELTHVGASFYDVLGKTFSDALFTLESVEKNFSKRKPEVLPTELSRPFQEVQKPSRIRQEHSLVNTHTAIIVPSDFLKEKLALTITPSIENKLIEEWLNRITLQETCDYSIEDESAWKAIVTAASQGLKGKSFAQLAGSLRNVPKPTIQCIIKTLNSAINKETKNRTQLPLSISSIKIPGDCSVFPVEGDTCVIPNQYNYKAWSPPNNFFRPCNIEKYRGKQSEQKCIPMCVVDQEKCVLNPKFTSGKCRQDASAFGESCDASPELTRFTHATTGEHLDPLLWAARNQYVLENMKMPSKEAAQVIMNEARFAQSQGGDRWKLRAQDIIDAARERRPIFDSERKQPTFERVQRAPIFQD